MNLSAHTKLLCVIGSPIKHSMSPRIHNGFIEKTKLDYAYMAFEVGVGQASEFIQAARLLGIVGFNVTMPLKNEICTLMDVLDEKAQLFGAVNTVALKDGLTYGYNTDGDGFMRAVGTDTFQHAVILGFGGASKTIALTLAMRGVPVTVVSRRAADLEPCHPGVSYAGWDLLTQLLPGCDLLVNGTPLGMGTQDFDDLSFIDALPVDALVCDLIYAPPETSFLRAARARGLKTLNGMPMLKAQAALAFSIFTGKTNIED